MMKGFIGRMGRAGAANNGGSGGGGMLRVAKRPMRVGVNGQDSVASSSSSRKSTSQKPTTIQSKHALTLSSSALGNTNNAANNSSSEKGSEIVNNWEYLENYFYDGDDYSNDDDKEYDVFGVVPSVEEAESALLSLGRLIPPMSPSSTPSKNSNSSDWVEPPDHMQIYDQRFPRSHGLDRVYDAFNLLQTEPSVQKMVISLSSDKAVWTAILNNDAVREIRESYLKESNLGSSDEDVDSCKSNPNIMKWMLDNMKAKLLEVIEVISQLVGDVFQPPDLDKTKHSTIFSDKLKSSFLLTVVVLLIVVVTRAKKG